jgi:hypothetical protein
MKSSISRTAGTAVRAGLFLLVAMSLGWTANCSPAQQKTAENVAVKIAEDACKEIAGQTGSPDWVSLACTAGTDIVNVTMPKSEWQSIKARKANTADAGTIVPVPGK